MTGSLVGSDLVGDPAADKPGLSLVVEVDVFDGFKIVGASLLQSHVVGRSLLSLIAQSTLRLRDELLLGLAHIVHLLLIAEVDVRVLQAGERPRLTVVTAHCCPACTDCLLINGGNIFKVSLLLISDLEADSLHLVLKLMCQLLRLRGHTRIMIHHVLLSSGQIVDWVVSEVEVGVPQVRLHLLDLLHGGLASLRIIFIRFNSCHLGSADCLNLVENRRARLRGVCDLNISLLCLGRERGRPS